jgi:toxin-antitoxin system PIN domain toxin
VWLCDSNVWLALALSEHVHHRATRDWLQKIDEAESVFFCRATQQSFVRLLTNASVLAPYGNPPLTNRQAWKAFETLLADDRIVLNVEEPVGLDTLWKKLALRDTASPKLWMDAYLAAFAMAGAHRLVTTDAAFKQFRGLELELLAKPAAKA